MENAYNNSDEQQDKPKLVRLFPEDDSPVIIDPEGPRHPLARKLLSIIAIIIVLIIGVYLLRFPLSGLFSSKLYISLVAENTIKALSRELTAISAENNVIKRGAALLGEPYEQRLRLNAGIFGLNNQALDITVKNDNKRDQLLLELANEGAGFYLSDDIVGFKVNGGAFSTNPNEAGSEINSILETNGSDIRLPDEINLSYGVFKRLFMGGSLSAVSPAYVRVINKYQNLVQSLYNAAKMKNSSGEKLSLGTKTVNCKTVSIQISGQSMKEWLGILADTIRDDDDLTALLGRYKNDFERMIRGQQFFYNGTVFIKLCCYDNRIISIRYSHLESQTFFEVSTTGEKNRLDNISFVASGVHDIKFQAVSDYIPPDEFHVNLFVNGLGRLDALDKLQIVWELSKGSDNVTYGKSGKVLGRYTFAENEYGVLIDIPKAGSNEICASYRLTEMNDRPVWPDDARPVRELNPDWLKGLY